MRISDWSSNVCPSDLAALPEQPTAAPTPRQRRRGQRLRRFVLLVLIPLLAIAVAAAWYTLTGRYVTTGNAYVKAHVIAVSTDIDGRVIGVPVDRKSTRLNSSH